MLDESHHPRGNTGKADDIAVHRIFDNRFYFCFPFTHQGDFQFGRSHAVYECAAVLQQYCREVSARDTRRQWIYGVAASQNKAFPKEEFIVRIVPKISCYDIESTLIVAFFQAFAAYGNEFAFVVGCSGRFGKPFYFRRPYQVVFSAKHTVDIRFYPFVIDDRNTRCEIGIALYVAETVSFAYFCISCRMQQIVQLLFLYGVAMLCISVMAMLPAGEIQIENRW